MIAANKSDLAGVTPGEYAKGVINQVEALLPDVRAPPVLSVCALDGEVNFIFFELYRELESLFCAFYGRKCRV